MNASGIHKTKRDMTSYVMKKANPTEMVCVHLNQNEIVYEQM